MNDMNGSLSFYARARSAVGENWQGFFKRASEYIYSGFVAVLFFLENKRVTIVSRKEEMER